MKYTNKMLAGLLIFVGTAAFFSGIILSEALYPGYHVTQVISDLGVGPTAWLFNSTISIFGIFLIIRRDTYEIGKVHICNSIRPLHQVRGKSYTITF